MCGQAAFVCLASIPLLLFPGASFTWESLTCSPQFLPLGEVHSTLQGGHVAQAWPEAGSEMGKGPKPIRGNEARFQDFYQSPW